MFVVRLLKTKAPYLVALAVVVTEAMGNHQSLKTVLVVDRYTPTAHESNDSLLVDSRVEPTY